MRGIASGAGDNFDGIILNAIKGYGSVMTGYNTISKERRVRDWRPARELAVAFLMFFMFSLCSCSGWSTGSLVMEGMEKIYVPFFQNDTYYRGLEEQLTRAVINRINERTDLFLVDKNSAEMILEGRIIKYEQRVLSEDQRNRILESSATTTVAVQLIRASDRKVIKESVLADTAEFYEALGEDLETSQLESFRVLSAKIVSIVEKSF
jgi:hypothetical protein